MAYAKTCVFTLLMMMSFLGSSMGAQTYQVGDSAGWTNDQGIDYNYWAFDIKFQVGDTIVFNYNSQFHNVLQVSKEDFEACSAIAPLVSYTGGSNSILLNAPGTYYFICGAPGMCQDGGQKVEIKVPSPKTPFFPPLTNPTPPLCPNLTNPMAPPATHRVEHGASSPVHNQLGLVIVMFTLCVLAFHIH